jgi:hypothetical protein
LCSKWALGFTINSGSCLDCTSVVSNCQNCTLTECQACASPYILSNPTSCSTSPSPSCGANCVTCSDPVTCSVCTTGYQPDETFACVLMPTYFTNITGTYLCSIKIANCLTCTPDGLTCLTCSIGFTVNSGACLDCTTVVSNCQNCSLVDCQVCVSPYVLNSLTSCIISPAPTPPPSPIPPNPLSCTSNLCQTCNSLNPT